MDLKQEKWIAVHIFHNSFLHLKMTDLELDGDEHFNCHEPDKDD
jgi:hypothetical protein